MDEFRVNGYSHRAFSSALCEHKGWTGKRAEKASRIVEACDEWSNRYGVDNHVFGDPETARTDCESFVCRSLGISALMALFTIIRLVVSYYIRWYYSNFTQCREAQQS